MILIVDAHALLWWLGDDAQLAADARDAIASPYNEVLVSAATVWEIEIKRVLGKLDAPAGIVAAIESAGLGALPISLADAEKAAHLPNHHRDPFDRMLVAQAQRLDAVLLTRDEVFSHYGADTIRA